MTTTAEPIDTSLPVATETDGAVPTAETDDQDLLVEDVSIDGMCGVY